VPRFFGPPCIYDQQINTTQKCVFIVFSKYVKIYSRDLLCSNCSLVVQQSFGLSTYRAVSWLRADFCASTQTSCPFSPWTCSSETRQMVSGLPWSNRHKRTDRSLHTGRRFRPATVATRLMLWHKCTKHQFIHLLTATLKNSHIENSKNHKRWYCPHHIDCE